jgi:RimJ/RimL family protein N-acetyltransferase
MVMIQSERLNFRKIEDSDFEIIAAIMRDAGVQKIWEHYFSDDDVREWIARRKKGYETNGIDYLLAINKLSQEVVGQVGLLKENIEGEEVWGIGYILMSGYYGNGYATEGAKAMADYAFNTLKATKIICDIRPMNKSSIAVVKRIGMIETGMYIKKYRGQEMPHLIYALNSNQK